VSRPAQTWDEWDADLDDLEVAVGGDAAFVPVEAPRARPPRPGRTPARRPGVEPTPAPRPRRRVRWGQLAAVGLVGYLIAMGASSEVSLLRVSHEGNALARQVAVLEAENQSLSREVGLLHGRRYVTELARTELGYVSPGEVELVPVRTTSRGGASGP
jgi:cell division protein FtsB